MAVSFRGRLRNYILGLSDNASEFLFYRPAPRTLVGMTPARATRTKDRVLHELKTKGPRSAAELARRLDVTREGARQHLAALERDGLVTSRPVRGRVGRPERIWSLTDSPGVDARFPDSHAELAVGLLEAARAAFGAEGLDHLVRERARRQALAYRKRIPARAPLRDRVKALAAIRTEEGYLADWAAEGNGFLLVENHCPVCAAARSCRGLCRAELELFRRTLGRDVRVERTEYLLDGARRCAYRVEPATTKAARARATSPDGP
jgi:predicted ArsR family transcriptional regulator